MDSETRSRVIAEVERAGKKRYEAQGGVFSDADFAAGALAAMQAMGLKLIDFPASWTLGIMFGRRSPFREVSSPGEPA